MPDGVVEKLYGDFKPLVEFLDEHGEPSFRSFVEDLFRKAILLAAASYFEDRLVTDLLGYIKGITIENHLVSEFANHQALKRKYHTLFDWNSSNANQFFKLFGTRFYEFMTEQVKNDDDLKSAIEAFMAIGSDRNRLVHQNFASFALEKNSAEIYELYTRALGFVEALPTKLKECPRPE
ncbi:MAG TPA: HEPN domain-containing protein [Pyrinomonadaceae bacterium]|nr:HEPN domain-containing protein [Pyrinomonadaceae bacterium]